MPTQIRQLESEDGRDVMFVIEGDLLLEDAVLLEKLAADLQEESDKKITIDLADLSFIDSESAPVIRRLGEREGVRIQGIEIFLQSAVNSAERMR
ncbi:hypothetical protein BH24ACI3_BH24ACI3_11380 [soil metagenome]